MSLPKVKPVRSEAYRRYVAEMPCDRCRVVGLSQACHGDLGKGMATKTSDLTCWPGCGDRPSVIGCHTFVGRHLSREGRREFEAAAAVRTRAALRLKSHSNPKLRAVLVKLGLV